MKLEEPALLELRRHMAVRYTGLMGLVGGLLVFSRLDRPWPVVAAGVLGVAGLLMLWRRYRRGRVPGGRLDSAVFLFLSLLPLVFVRTWNLGGLPPFLSIGGVTGPLFYLVAGPALGWTAYAAFLAGCALAAFSKPLSPLDLGLLSDLALAASVLQAMAMTYVRTFGLLRQEAGNRHAQLDNEMQARHRLVKALLEELEAPLREPLGPEEDPSPRVKALLAGLRRARQMRMDMQAPEELDVDLRISRRLLPPLLGLGVLTGAAISLRDVLMGEPASWIGLALAGALLVLFVAVLRGVVGWSKVAVGTVVAGLLAVFMGCVAEAGRLPHALAYGVLLVSFAGLWLGIRPAVAAGVLLAVAELLSWQGRGLVLASAEHSTAVNYLASWVLLAFIIAPAAERQQGLLSRLERQQAELAAGLKVRRRLLGTLHHDAANLVQGLDALCAIGLTGPRRETFVRIQDRLLRLVGSARFWLFEDRPFRPEQLLSADLRPLVDGQDAVFGPRLQEKQVALEVDVPPSLKARCLPVVLSESVLGNLISNAIKFSPAGGRIRVTAWLQEGQVCLSVHDVGQGFRPEQLRRFEDGDELASTLGTRGESGQGLGLGLAEEHLRRMGGRLELLNGAGGGAEARIWLAAA